VDYRPFVLQVLDANEQPVARVAVEGRQIVSLLLPSQAGQTKRFWLHVKGGGRRIANDPRIMNFAAFRCFWAHERQAASLPDHASQGHADPLLDPFVLEEEDIVPRDVGLRFGPGWHAVQHSHGEWYRWAGDGAAIAVTSSHGRGNVLSLELEPGPDVGYRPFHLQVCDASGQVVAQKAIKDRQLVHLTLPVRPGHTGHYRLHVEERSRLLPRDARARYFRVLKYVGAKKPNESDRNGSILQSIRFQRENISIPAEADIAPAEMRLCFGAGWSARQQENGAFYRWMANDAHFTIQEMADTPVKTLSLDLEAAPGLAERPLQLQIRDAGGRIMAQEPFEGRQLIRLMLRVRPGMVERFQFHVEADGAQGLGEPGGPVLRLFRCNWSKPGISVPDRDIVSPLPLHTCACGDFTLLAREDWFDLLGYPEFEMFSLHIDSVLCYLAHHHGVVEEMLDEPMRIYHIEHGTGSGWTPEGADKLMERIADKGISCLECQEVLAWATEMRRLDRPLVLNYEDWGMRDDVLPETIVAETASEANGA
jgi:hypothetical protein